MDIDMNRECSANRRRLLDGSDDPRGPDPYLVLTTTGRKSGEPRSTPLIYGEDGDRS